jgi:hypothetical protein
MLRGTFSPSFVFNLHGIYSAVVGQVAKRLHRGSIEAMDLYKVSVNSL